MMLQRHADSRLSWSGAGADSVDQIRGTIELPVDLIDRQCDLIDRVVSFAFDTLGLHTIELRIRPPAVEAGNRTRSQAL